MSDMLTKLIGLAFRVQGLKKYYNRNLIPHVLNWPLSPKSDTRRSIQLIYY